MTNALMVKVDIRSEDGAFYATSPNVAGLHVYGETQEQACESAIKAVRALFKYNRGLDVDVAPVTADVQAFPAVSRCDGFVVQHRMAA